jgi:6-phosphofructokinase 1
LGNFLFLFPTFANDRTSNYNFDMKPSDFEIKTLGQCNIDSPVALSTEEGDGVVDYVPDDERVFFNVVKDRRTRDEDELLLMERAGPREHIYFDGAKTRVAIVTCGGLCPGINNVIRSLVMTLHYRYGVNRILGVQYGYQGFIAKYKHDFIELTPKNVANIFQFGGTILGSSRGKQDIGEIVDCLERYGINILFTIGGDGTLRGALSIQEEVEKRGLKISVTGIPKTIDNDINLIEKSFGFETSFTVASPIIRDAHNEAKGAFNGVAIVKLMGRDSGFIAAHAALSLPDVNMVLVPEIKFDLYGEKGLLNIVAKRLEKKNHCLIVVAEGAGQQLFEAEEARYDASGNKLHKDIGPFLKEKLLAHFKEQGTDITVKYIDPSYIIRSAPATPSDSIFCNKLGMHAVHGAMAGKTGFVVGRIHNMFVYLPISLVIGERKKIDPEGDLWLSVLETTGQPMSMVNG